MKTTLLVTTILCAAGVARAQQFQPQHRVDLSTEARRSAAELDTQAADALIRHDAQRALTFADQAIAADASDPWAHYNRGAALSELQRTDEAVQSFHRASDLFGNADPWGRSLALYGVANAYASVGRCVEARPAFQCYANYVSRSDPPAADLARKYASSCAMPTQPPTAAAPLPSVSERQAVSGKTKIEKKQKTVGHKAAVKRHKVSGTTTETKSKKKNCD